jgi:hypothetical protein
MENTEITNLDHSKNKQEKPDEAIKKRKEILDLNKIESDCNPFPEMIQDDSKSRIILIFFIMGFYMSFRQLQLIVENLVAFTEENNLNENLTPEQKAENDKIVEEVKIAIILFAIKLSFYIVLIFFFGYSNSTPNPRIKTAVVGLIISIGLFLTLGISGFITNFETAFEFAMIGLMCLYCLFYIITSCRKKGRFFSNFTTLKNEIYFEYTFQKLFKKPSMYWEERQKKIFKKKVLNVEGQLSETEINERFRKYVKEQENQDYLSLNIFKKVYFKISLF